MASLRQLLAPSKYSVDDAQSLLDTIEADAPACRGLPAHKKLSHLMRESSQEGKALKKANKQYKKKQSKGHPALTFTQKKTGLVDKLRGRFA
jgi:hypothetical protein